jgi:phosphoribosyl 1,2-cyclic phosphodiesterase
MSYMFQLFICIDMYMTFVCVGWGRREGWTVIWSQTVNCATSDAVSVLVDVFHQY